MPDNRDLDQPDRPDDALLDDEEGDEVVGMEDDDEDDEFEDVDDEEFDEEPRNREATDEVGDEGGSPGESITKSQSRLARAGGSEAGETWRASEGEQEIVDHRGRGGRPIRRAP
jgi:hypothetical protein